MAIEEVEKLIEKHKPRVVFAPHVETSTGVELPAEYVKRIGEGDEKVVGRNFRVGRHRRRDDVDRYEIKFGGRVHHGATERMERARVRWGRYFKRKR